MLISHLYIFGEMSDYLFCPVFSQIVDFLIIEL